MKPVSKNNINFQYKKYSKRISLIIILAFIVIGSIPLLGKSGYHQSDTTNNTNQGDDSNNQNGVPNQNAPSQFQSDNDLVTQDYLSNNPSNTEPESQDDWLSYEFTENPLWDGFDDSNLDPWTTDYTIGSDSSGLGWIYCYDGMAYMKGENQETNLPGQYNIPELPEDMAINSGNLVDPDHPWSAGQLEVYFIPTNIKTIVTTSAPYVMVSTFYINYRTSPSDSFLSHNLYTYTKDQFYNEVPVTVTLDLTDIQIDNYFEISLRLECWTRDTYVAIDYVRLRSYSINITESQDPIPSNQDEIITVDIKQTYFTLNTDGATVSVYLNPDGGVVDSSCPSYTAAGDNTNPFTIIIDKEAYIQGEVSYKIRFEDINGGDFWTPTYHFYCYDDEAPTTGTPTYNSSPPYENDLSISIPIHDTGGAHLDTAILVWDYNQAPTENSALKADIESSPWGVDDFTATFTIPSEYLQVGETLQFQVWVYDRAGNKGSSAVYNVNPVDNIAPVITIWEHSYHYDTTLNRNIAELGYPIEITWRVEEPNQASGFNVNDPTCLYIGIKNGSIEPSDPLDYDHLYSVNIQEHSALYTLHWDEYYSEGDYLWVFIYSRDKSGNENWNKIELYVADLQAPEIAEPDENSIAPNFDQDFVLNFSAWEPARANGVNASSIIFKYSINNEDLSSVAPVDPTYSKIYDDNGLRYNYSYVISASLYNYNDTIYYYYQAQDNKGNTIIIERSIIVGDYISPDLKIVDDDFSISNYSIVYTYFDMSLACHISDQEGGSGIATIQLYLKNASHFGGFGDVYSWYYYEPISNEGDLYHFLIPEENITIDGIVIFLEIKDGAGNSVSWNKSIDVYDATKPTVEYYNLGTVNEFYLNNLTTHFYFKLSIPAFMHYAVDGVRSQETITANNISVDITFSSEGTHVITVYFNDYSWYRSIIVDITAPNQVPQVSANLNGLNHEISWAAPPDLDPNEQIVYRIYRGTSEDFDISDGVLVNTTNLLSYTYKFDETGTWYYKIVAVDQALNEAPASPVSNAIHQVKSTSAGIAGGIIAGLAVGITAVALGVKKYRNFYGIEKKGPSKFSTIKDNIQNKIRQAKFKTNKDFAKTSELKQSSKLTKVNDVKSKSSIVSPFVAATDQISTPASELKGKIENKPKVGKEITKKLKKEKPAQSNWWDD